MAQIVPLAEKVLNILSITRIAPLPQAISPTMKCSLVVLRKSRRVSGWVWMSQRAERVTKFCSSAQAASNFRPTRTRHFVHPLLNRSNAFINLTRALVWCLPFLEDHPMQSKQLKLLTIYLHTHEFPKRYVRPRQCLASSYAEYHRS